jgi:hypothetical protein
MQIVMRPMPVNGSDAPVFLIFEDETDQRVFRKLELLAEGQAIVMLAGEGYLPVNIKQDLGRRHLAFIECGVQNVLIGYWRADAEEQGIRFGITASDLAWPRLCPALGLELEWVRFGDDTAQAAPVLSRVNPAFGYVPDNCLVVSRRAKSMRGA